MEQTGILTITAKSGESGFREKANGRKVFFTEEPTAGKRFCCWGEGVEFGVRMISTSPILALSRGEHTLIFNTESGSTYRLDHLQKS